MCCDKASELLTPGRAFLPPPSPLWKNTSAPRLDRSRRMQTRCGPQAGVLCETRLSQRNLAPNLPGPAWLPPQSRVAKPPTAALSSRQQRGRWQGPQPPTWAVHKHVCAHRGLGRWRTAPEGTQGPSWEALAWAARTVLSWGLVWGPRKAKGEASGGASHRGCGEK